MLETQTHRIAWALAVLLLTAGTAPAAVPLGTEFSYQAQLKLGGVPLNDTADFEFSLYDADSNGLLVAGPITVSNVAVVDGLLQVSLDFGVNVLNGDARWLEVAVRSPHDPGDTLPFTTLDTPQQLTGVPYALQTRGLFVDDAGNVGIGETSPSATLDVVGATELNGDVTINSNLTVDTDTLFVDGTTGNVGIGTSSPLSKLDVNGTVTANNLDVDGDIRFGPIQEFHVPADTDRTVIVRGKINSDGSRDFSRSTSGVSSSPLSGEGHYLVTFPSGAFSGVPIVTVTPINSGGTSRYPILDNVTTDNFEIYFRNENANRRNADFNFIAIGER